jgi:hypothetical protein
MLFLLLLTGCPSGFGKDGRIHRASHQDTLNLVRKACDRAAYEAFCSNGREKTSRCIEECG